MPDPGPTQIHYYEDFRFCPRCGRAYADDDFRRGEVLFVCKGCTFRFYQNAIPSSAVIVPQLRRPSMVLLITRATSPGLGRFALPGGILDYGETAEAAARRETLEETGVRIELDRLLCMPLIRYEYQQRIRLVLEHTFVAAPVDDGSVANATAEASRLAFYDSASVSADPSRFAFRAQCEAVALYAGEWNGD